MRKFYFLMILIIFLNMMLASSKKVLLIGIDGCRPDVLKIANTPNIDKLINNGIFFDNALSSINNQPTRSGPGWTSLLTGVWFDKHSVKDNLFKNVDNSKIVTFDELLTKSSLNIKTSVLTMWNPIITKIFDKELFFTSHVDTYDGSIISESKEHILNTKSDIIFVHIDNADLAGHLYGYSIEGKKYINAIEEIDSYVGTLTQSLKLRKEYKNEEWLIIISSDHGGRKKFLLGGTHGGQTDEEILIPIILYGKNINRIHNTGQTYIVDIVPTILSFFDSKLVNKFNLDGKALIEF
ncbi:MAG: hypothetical protein CMF98_04905 [Candidatus Marinimicrobia bacterium]|nr:hypothetical protein [Candidatus Neomarinimicrobiota bacterium]OUW50325.1 MAG: hypothetical protein CBD50_03500 [bacterium TMED190]